VLDALLHGAPVIATAGTWPGSQIERFGAGVTIGERTPEALSAAVDAVLRDWPAYAARACKAARILAKEHDPGHLLALIGGRDRTGETPIDPGRHEPAGTA
jgi:UDP:flavonoid glycosyltransferase YjiC (YdhE family)